MRALLRSMKPDNFEDISAVGALYRPGPMGANSHNEYADRKNGRKPVIPIHAELADALADILGDTYGLIVYQEQVMAIAQHVAGYSLGAADLLRRAMGKKKKSELDKQFANFSAGMKERGFSQAAVQTLWDILLPFSDYAFNKAHSAAYGLVSYWTAYLKANYPRSTWPRCSPRSATTRTSRRSISPSAATWASPCCHRMSTPRRRTSPRSAPTSASACRPSATSAPGAVASLIATRKAKGDFTDFSDFLSKVEAVVCNKKVVESLIKAGAFDSLKHPRKGLLMAHAEGIDLYMNVKKAEAAGQFDLFGEMTAEDVGGALTVTVPDTEWDSKLLLGFEREMLGLYVSGHPLAGIEHVLSAQSDASIPDIIDGTVPDRATVTIGGILTGLQRRLTKKGDPWASAQLEDLAGGVEVAFFPKVYAEFALSLAEDAVVLVKARVSRSEDRLSLHAQSVVVPDLSGPSNKGPMQVTMSATRCTPPVVDRLRDVLQSHPGTTAVHLRLMNGSRATTLRLDDGLRVTPTSALMGDLKALLGADCLA